MPNNTTPRARDAQDYADFVESMKVNGITDPEMIKEQAKTRGIEIATAAGVKPGDAVKPGGNPDTMPDSAKSDAALKDGSAAAAIPKTGEPALTDAKK